MMQRLSLCIPTSQGRLTQLALPGLTSSHIAPPSPRENANCIPLPFVNGADWVIAASHFISTLVLLWATPSWVLLDLIISWLHQQKTLSLSFAGLKKQCMGIHSASENHSCHNAVLVQEMAVVTIQSQHITSYTSRRSQPSLNHFYLLFSVLFCIPSTLSSLWGFLPQASSQANPFFNYPPKWEHPSRKGFIVSFLFLQ